MRSVEAGSHIINGIKKNIKKLHRWDGGTKRAPIGHIDPIGNYYRKNDFL
jgi:hypothetical protein